MNSWNQEQISLLTENWKKKEIDEMEKLIGKNWSSIRQKAMRLSLGGPYSYKPKNVLPKKIKDRNWRLSKYDRIWVNDAGTVWSARKAAFISPYLVKNGRTRKGSLFLKVTLNGVHKVIKLSHLVWETFHGDIPADYSVVLKDRNPLNCDIGNLVCGSKKQVGSATGYLARRHPVAEYRNRKMIKTYRSVRCAASELGVSYQTLLDHLKGKIKKPHKSVMKADIRYIYPDRVPVKKARN